MTREGWSSPLRLGRLGSYELIRPLARGGMADLYLARHTGAGLDRTVAVKVLNEHRAEDPEARALFLDEARVLGLLAHPNVAAVLDVDVEPAEGHHYLAMEYVDGVDVRELLHAAIRAGRAIPYETAIAIVTAAAAGLDHAHRRCDRDGRPLRLVHRDVSLSNIMVGHDGAVKVIDFGIASTAIASVHTVPGVVRGKASYMSPEQCLGDALDHRTDVFALGVVLYELTTGARCFHGKTDFERMLAVVRNEYIAPRTLVADYPEALEAIVQIALAPRADERFASCAAMIEALESVLVGNGWAGGARAIARLMSELFPTGRPPMLDREPTASAAAVAAELPTAPSSGLADAPAPDPADTARQPVLPPGAIAPASVPTVPRAPLARGSMRRFPHPRLAADGTVADDDAPTRGRRAVKRPASCSTKLVAAA